jgi:glucokinase
VLATAGDWLGRGLVTVATHLDPACFIIGGGLSAAGSALLGPAGATYRAKLPAADYRPIADIRVAALGVDAGVVGAADLARTAAGEM